MPTLSDILKQISSPSYAAEQRRRTPERETYGPPRFGEYGPQPTAQQLTFAKTRALFDDETRMRDPVASLGYEPSVVHSVPTNTDVAGLYLTQRPPGTETDVFDRWKKTYPHTLKALADQMPTEELRDFLRGDRVVMADRAMNDPAALSHEFRHRSINQYRVLPEEPTRWRGVPLGEESLVRLLDAIKQPNERSEVVGHFQNMLGLKPEFSDADLTSMLQDPQVLGSLMYMEKRAQEDQLKHRSGYKPETLHNFPTYDEIAGMRGYGK